ncbi:MAG: hypothetical protein M4D80_26825, partial [Myxococcota bacterium]|nr:hypothetical protein [Myxococcota bacterium]
LGDVRNEPGLSSGRQPVYRRVILITSVRKAAGPICQEGSRSHMRVATHFADILRNDIQSI